MAFTFKESKALNIDLKSCDKKIEDVNSASIGFKDQYSENDPKKFSVIFDIEIISCKYSLFVQYEALFESDENISDEFKQSQFPKVNAPAIAYPYLRAFISIVTLNSGFEPSILPTLNFQAMYNE